MPNGRKYIPQGRTFFPQIIAVIILITYEFSESLDLSIQYFINTRWLLCLLFFHLFTMSSAKERKAWAGVFFYSVVFVYNPVCVSLFPSDTWHLIDAVAIVTCIISVFCIKPERDLNSQTSLMDAASNGNMEVVEGLLNGTAFSGIVVLTIPAGGNNKYTLLLDNSKNANEAEALMAAAAHGQTNVVRQLLKRGARVDAQNESGQTALMAASSGRNTEVVKLLLDSGANPHIEASDGSTPLSIARDFHSLKILKLLTEHGAK